MSTRPQCLSGGGQSARREHVEVASSANAIDDSLRHGQPVVVEDGTLVAQSELVDVVEATGLPEVGARMAYNTLLNRKHLVMVNVETDVTIGPVLRRMADAAGVVYTMVDGDQPGCTMNVIDGRARWALRLWPQGSSTRLV